MENNAVGIFFLMWSIKDFITKIPMISQFKEKCTKL